MTPAHPLPFKSAALISEVDGTLVTDDKRLTAHTQAAAAELRASGIVFAIISSRLPRDFSLAEQGERP